MPADNDRIDDRIDDLVAARAGATDGLAAEVEPLAADGPPIAPAAGGWRRVLLGLLVGLAAGAILALVLPRRREVPPVDPLDPEPESGEAHVSDR